MAIEELRALCQTDPFELATVLGYDFQRDVHTAMFDLLLRPRPGVALQDLSETKKRLMLWPRGHFKTSAVAVNIVQLFLNYPDARILIMQGNLKLTKGLLAEVKSHFTGENTKSLLPRIFPEYCAPKLGSQMAFVLPARQRMHLKEASLTVASPRAVQTGQHYEAFYADDLVHTGNFRNIELLDKLESEFSHFVPLIDPGFYTTVTGTRYHHADLYGRIIRRNQGEWQVSKRGCFLPGGEPLFPEHLLPDGRKIGFTRALLDKIKLDDPEMFAAQYLNEIIAARSQIFPPELILGSVKSKEDEDFPKNSPTIFTVDLAESKRAHADHSVVAAGRAFEGRVWVTDLVGSTYSPHELVIVLLQMTLKHRPSSIFVEKTAGAETFKLYAEAMARERGMNLPITLFNAKNHKDAKYIRIAALESRLRQKTLFLCAGIPDWERVMEEFTQFPKGAHDDRPDVIAMLMEHFAQGFGMQAAKPKLPWFLTQPAPVVEDQTPYWARRI